MSAQRRLLIFGLLAASLGAGGLAACGGNLSAPTQPSATASPTGFVAPAQPNAAQEGFIGRFDAGAPQAAGPSTQQVPGAPSNLVASVSGSTVTLTWTAASGDPTTYVIEAGSSPGLANLANFATGNLATRFTATNVPNGTYFVRVRARNSSGTGSASNEVTVVVGSACTRAPGPPTGLAASVSAQSVSLTWNPPTSGDPATSYIVRVGSTSGASNLFNSNVGNVTSVSRDNVGTGTYFARALAVNACGQSGASNEVSFGVSGPCGPPYPSTGPGVIACAQSRYPERLVATRTLEERVANMEFLRDRIIEIGLCGGMDLGWNLKRGGPELSIDFLVHRHPTRGDIGVDIGRAYDDYTSRLQLQWLESTLPFYLRYSNPYRCDQGESAPTW